ncbi:MAG: MotA/TolQ/ExbB proton channel family protein [Verrucomicrobiota bacterium]
MWTEFIDEFHKLSREGGWIYWTLILLAFAIAAGLISIAFSLFGKYDKMDHHWIKRRIEFCFVLIGAAPLVGLLGTVDGMLKTFSGLSRSTGGGSAPIDAISGGISEALITTQTGLIIAVPTLIVCTILNIRHRNLRYRHA